ncbi:MAG TPA: response regulator [Gemmatimonadales bacterium]|nr:response regulator [Gemmatimonadales bacterium]
MSPETIRPPDDQVELMVQRDLVQAFRVRLRSDSTLVLLGHAVVMALVAATLAKDGLGIGLAWWMGFIALTTATRVTWQRAAAGPALSEHFLFSGTRAIVLLHGLAWGVGGAILLPLVPHESLAMVLIGFTGIIASATSTLVADRASMRWFLMGMCGPVVVRFILEGHPYGFAVAGLVAGYCAVALTLNRRSHESLTDALRATGLLSLSHQTLRYKTAMLEAQVNASIDGILMVGAQGQTLLTNKRMGEMWGIPPAIANDVDDSKRLRFVVSRTRHPEEFLARVEYLYAHPAETSREEIELTDETTLDRYSAPVTGHDGEQYGRIWTFRDITQSKRAEQAMREARDLAERAAESRSMFLANMSHEIRTPMNAVLGMIEIVLDSELTVDQRHSLGVASSSAESLLGTLNDVLDFSKIEAGRLDVETIPFDLQRLVQSTASLLALKAAQKDLELIADLAPEVPGMVRGDPSRLRQILTNLVGNAIKFTERGEVIIGVRPEPMEDGRPGVRFSVRDTGVGIAAEKLGDIFKEFTQADGSTSRRFGGTGLGLTISQRLAGLMGGRIIVTSEVGTGSEFRFTLPLAAESVTIPAVPANIGGLGGRSILVVDDRAVNRRIFGQMLGIEGAHVVEAEDVASALSLLRAARDAGTVPSLAIVDAQMPGQDGYHLAKLISRDPSLAGTPLLMLTSTGRRGDAARCRELGVAGYLTKPVSRSDLLETVAAILGGEGVGGIEGSIITRHSLAEAREPLRILLAEDNTVNQEVAATMLRKRGHHVDLAGNGREAVAAVRQAHYDVVLMDIQMPEMDGFEATAAIRAMPDGREIPIIALTAHAFSAERDRCRTAGMNGFVSKPFRSHELFAAVEGRVGETPGGVAPEPVLAVQVVDLEILRSQLREAGAEAALDGIVDTFLESVPERVKTLRDALTGGTAAEVATAAHALKSSAGAIGAGPLAALLAEVEAAGLADTLSGKVALADRVRDASTAVLTDLRAYRAEAA